MIENKRQFRKRSYCLSASVGKEWKMKVAITINETSRCGPTYWCKFSSLFVFKISVSIGSLV